MSDMALPVVGERTPSIRRGRQIGQPTLGSSRPQRRKRALVQPLTGICLAQTILALTFVWSNTAFADEANYLWLGHLLIAHWLHGTPWPANYADTILSGSPMIYLPIGAMADSIGGLAGARILSLLFMLGATILLYLTTSRLFGRRAAIFAAAIWAISEPAIRLAFATYDPLSTALTALSGWLVVEAAYRRHQRTVGVLASGALALANATAYSGLVIDPVVVAFAFAVWLPYVGVRRALLASAGFVISWMGFFALWMTISDSWSGILFTVINRKINDYNTMLLVLTDSLKYGGPALLLALAGATIAVASERRHKAMLVCVLGAAAWVVPVAQIKEATGWSLDKHLSYSIWFGAMAAGYGCSRIIRKLPEFRRSVVSLSCVIAALYPAVASWEAGWFAFHHWADASSFITALRPILQHNNGPIYAEGLSAGGIHVAQYYLPQGHDWKIWSNTGISLDPSSIKQSSWNAYYSGTLKNANFGVIVLFYSATPSEGKFAKSERLFPGKSVYGKLMGLGGNYSRTPGLSDLTRALSNSHRYRLAVIGPYNRSQLLGRQDDFVYAIWERVPK